MTQNGLRSTSRASLSRTHEPPRKLRWPAAHQQGDFMKRFIPLTAVAGVLACLVAAGTAQAAPLRAAF